MTNSKVQDAVLKSIKQIRNGLTKFAEAKGDNAELAYEGLLEIKDAVEMYVYIYDACAKTMKAGVSALDAINDDPKKKQMFETLIANTLQDVANRGQEFMNLSEAVIKDPSVGESFNEVLDSFEDAKSFMKKKMQAGSKHRPFHVVDEEALRDEDAIARNTRMVSSLDLKEKLQVQLSQLTALETDLMRDASIEKVETAIGAINWMNEDPEECTAEQAEDILSMARDSIEDAQLTIIALNAADEKEARARRVQSYLEQ